MVTWARDGAFTMSFRGPEAATTIRRVVLEQPGTEAYEQVLDHAVDVESAEHPQPFILAGGIAETAFRGLEAADISPEHPLHAPASEIMRLAIIDARPEANAGYL